MSEPAQSTSFGGPPESQAASLSVLIPTYNEADWIERNLTCLSAAIERADWVNSEVIVINDGSTDGTSQILGGIRLPLNLRVLNQTNQGFLVARIAGLQWATGDYVLFLDARIQLEPNALKFIRDQSRDHPERQVWNGHVEISRESNFYARFWHAVTRIAWRRYLTDPQLTSYTAADFDYYPKGGGCFFTPRSILLNAYSTYDAPQRVTDDELIRRISERLPIFLSPDFGCTYQYGRDSFRAFLKHAFARGIHVPDDFLNKTSRYFWPLVAFLLLSPLAIVVTFVRPIILIAVPLIWAVAAAAGLKLGIAAKDAAAFGLLSPAFAIAYGAGIWKGFFLLAKVRFRRSNWPKT